MKIEPDKQFIASPERLAMLLNQYDLILLDYSEASSGIENSTLITTTKQGKFVVRIYRQGKKSLSEINLEVDFINFLREHDIKVPEILQNNVGAYVTNLKLGKIVWHAIVMDFVEGEHAKSYTQQLISELAVTQARMHILSSNYQVHGTTRANELTELRKRYSSSKLTVQT